MPDPMPVVPLSDEERADSERYTKACHAMQTAVALEISRGDDKATDPKHLRVGVNIAMCDHAALVHILVAKGIITRGEYLKMIADEMEREVARYRALLNLPDNVFLH